MQPEAARRDRCRLCDGGELERVVSMPPTPIADAYCSPDQAGSPQPAYPLDLYFCRGCAHVQLLDVVDPRLMFKPDYTYRTGSTPAIVRHFQDLAQRVLERERPAARARVVDIGSNDGTYLRFFRDAGLEVLGFDPAERLAREARAAGVETIVEFLTPQRARRLRQERGAARLVTANNVFAHADDMAGMAESVRELLAPDGLFVFEVSYLVDVIEKMLLGTIFHEHLCYHSVGPLSSFLKRHGLELVDAERTGVQGGSLIGYAQPQGGPRAVSSRVSQLLDYERAEGFDRPEPFREFNERLDRMRASLAELFDAIEARGQAVAGYGAARGGTTILYRLELGRRLQFIVDDSRDKQGLLSPGHHLPILPSQALYERKPAYALILAWVHARTIIDNHAGFVRQGGRFITAHPRVGVFPET